MTFLNDCQCHSVIEEMSQKCHKEPLWLTALVLSIFCYGKITLFDLLQRAFLGIFLGCTQQHCFLFGKTGIGEAKGDHFWPAGHGPVTKMVMNYS